MRLLSTFLCCLFIGSFAAQSEPSHPASGEQLAPQQLSDQRLSPKEDLQFNAVESPAHPFFAPKADQGASKALRSPLETNKLSAIHRQTSLHVPSAEVASVLRTKKLDRYEMQSGDCLATGLTAMDGGCSDEGQGLLPVISLTFDIAGTCDVEDLCWGVNGETPTCINLPDAGFNIGNGEGINLINTTEDAFYEIYFTTISGASGTIFYQNGNCNPQCLPLSVTAEDLGCSDEGQGELPVIGLTFEIDGDCEVVDLCFGVDGSTPECFNMPDNGFNLGNGDGISLINTVEDGLYEIYFTTSDGTSGTLFYQNGNCDPNQCLPVSITATNLGCSDEGQGLLPVIGLTFEIEGDCEVIDLCWGVNGETPTCVNLPDNGFNLGNGEGLNLINTIEDGLYEIYFTTIDGTSDAIFYQNVNCEPQCLPVSITAEDLGCADEGQGELPVIGLTFEIDGECEVIELCWGVNGETPTCVNLPDNGFNLGNGEGINLINTVEDGLYEIYFTTIDGTSDVIFYQNGNCNDEILGCTDPDALNYNPDANVDDGSCIYECVFPTVFYEAYCSDEFPGLFYVNVVTFDDGNGSPYIISNSETSQTIVVEVPDIYIMGPFESSDVVIIEIESIELPCLMISDPFEMDCLTGIWENGTTSLEIYPNPADGQLFIENPSTEVLDVLLYDIYGNIIDIWRLDPAINAMEIDQLAAGVYFLHSIDKAQIRPFRFIKR